ncbi:efflux RND transporter periplasmic adaptor subunit [Vibrio harveyi]
MHYKIIITSLILLFLTSLGYVWSVKRKSESFINQLVTEKLDVDTILFTGILEPSKTIDINSVVSGKVDKLYFNQNDFVKKDELIATVDAEIANNNLKIAEQELITAKLGYEQSALEYKSSIQDYQRQKLMLKNGSTSNHEYEKYKTIMDINKLRANVANIKVESVKSKVKKAIVEMNYTDIRAPFDGYILQSYVEEGQNLVSTQSVSPLVKFAQLSTLHLNVNIPSIDINKINIDEDVSVYTRGGRLIGEFSFKEIDLEPSLQSEKSNSSYKGTIVIPNQNNNFRIGSSLLIKKKMKSRKLILINKNCVYTVNDSHSVRRVGHDGDLENVLVEIDTYDKDSYSVKKGIVSGQLLSCRQVFDENN